MVNSSQVRFYTLQREIPLLRHSVNVSLYEFKELNMLIRNDFIWRFYDLFLARSFAGPICVIMVIYWR